MESGTPELLSLLFTIGRSMRESMRRNIQRNGKPGSFLQFETLRYVKEHKQPYMRDVAAFFHITPPAATLLIDGLVREKLLMRRFDPKDRRAIRIALTPTGARYLSKGIAAHQKRLAALFNSLNAEERSQLIRILRKISKTITTS
ncbi:MAG TPA: MarR family transcriptional regulator [Candidatus Paceibacterota bacterium]|nr:MarR family transcriptional regulator [Candidatus Paceibacterota bacterium]